MAENGKIEVEPDRLTKEQRQRLASVESSEDLQGILHPPRPGDETEPASMLGGEYEIGDITVAPVPAGVVATLAMIESPFLIAPEEDEEAPIPPCDTILALYIIAKGREVVDEIMGIRARLRNLKTLERDARRDPEVYQVYLALYDQAGSGAWRELYISAREFYIEIGAPPIMEITSVITAVIADAFGGFDLLSLAEDDEKKKEDSGTKVKDHSDSSGSALTPR